MRKWVNDFRWQWVAPLMVYFAAGVAGFTGIAETFLVKERFGFEADFLVSLSFWAVLPWALKIPVGHLIDIFWKWRALVIVGAGGLMAASLFVIALLAQNPELAPALLGLKGSYAVCAISLPFCFMIQDAIADAMTVQAVENGLSATASPEEHEEAHGSMQALGRAVLVSGGLLVAVLNMFIFENTTARTHEDLNMVYAHVFLWALLIPLVSVTGVWLGAWKGNRALLPTRESNPVEKKLDWTLLGASALMAGMSILSGVMDFSYAKELVFCVNFFILSGIATWISKELPHEQRVALACSGAAIFVFRAQPSVGPGLNWWMIDQLQFDQSFLAQLGFVSSLCALSGIFIYKQFLARLSLYKIVALLTLVGALLSLPTLGLWHGLHHWLEGVTGGRLGARFIALADETLAAPLTELAMIPMLAWIAKSAPTRSRAAWFATLASLSNLALSFSRLSTGWLNKLYPIVAAKQRPEGMLPGNYENLGHLLWISFFLSLTVPLLVCWLAHRIETRLNAQTHASARRP